MKTYKVIIGVLSLIAWLFLFIINWKIGLCILFILWQENITNRKL